MSYAVKEMFLTLQGEGMNAGARAVFVRFAGCNLWSGREQDRASAICKFCDTDFVGLDGDNGGRYDAASLADTVVALWGALPNPLVVMTGGEPLLQVDAELLAALRARGVETAVETPVHLSKRQKELLEEFEKAGRKEETSPESEGFFAKVKDFWNDLTEDR